RGAQRPAGPGRAEPGGSRRPKDRWPEERRASARGGPRGARGAGPRPGGGGGGGGGVGPGRAPEWAPRRVRGAGGGAARGAHGAASELAPVLLRRAGADVIAIGAEPDGENINTGCGSTHLETLSAAVVKHGADAGIAHDGDADRCLAVDAAGQVIDGDQIL